MELQLKERLVGAMVLVFAAVVFIPMVLDGPDARRVSRSVALPVTDEAATERRTVRLDLDAPEAAETEPAPAPMTEEPAAVDLVPQQQQESSVAQVPSRESSARPTVTTAQSAPKPASHGEMPWTVQAGSFSQEDNAEALAAKLRGLGYPAYVSKFNDGKRVHYRVRVGGFTSRDAAQSKADEIRSRTGGPATPQPNS